MTRTRTRLWLLALENRIAPAVFTVINLSDSGAGSLRQAILDANALSGADEIDIAYPGTITLYAGEMAIYDSVRIIGPGSGLFTIRPVNLATTRIFSVSGR